MTDSNNITPPPELVQELCDEPKLTWLERLHLAYQAGAQWGADTELEKCCEWLMADPVGVVHEAVPALRAARRPKPQTLNSIALQMLGTIERDAHYLPEITDTIRRALEALPE
jgi:hypothetical protein